MQVCETCGQEFPPYPVIGDRRLNLHARKRCLGCLPPRRLRGPRKPVARLPKIKSCDACGTQFPAKAVVDGKVRSLYRRSFCLRCSPFGTHNTSRRPPAIELPEELKEHRRLRRNAKTYRWQKRERRRRKAELVAARGGRCETCAYDRSHAALEFHHRDARTKEFGLGAFSGSRLRLLAEAQKCDLLCANCHRLRHTADERSPVRDSAVRLRRANKARAVAHMGGACFACGRNGPPPLFEFHHWDAKEKDFGISEDGVVRRWEKIVAELEKCVMLCANCHREVHSGVRELDEGLLGLAEPPVVYRAA